MKCMENIFVFISLGGSPLSDIHLGSAARSVLSGSHVLTNRPFWGSRINYWHFYVFLQAENKKFSSATQAYTKSLFKHNCSELSDQFNNTPKTAAKCYLFCLSKPFNLLSLSIFQGVFIVTSFHIFPLVYLSNAFQVDASSRCSSLRSICYSIAKRNTNTNPEKSNQCESSCGRQVSNKNHQCSLPLWARILSPTTRCSIIIHTITIHLLGL